MVLRDTLKARWFWYSNLCVLCWGGWALLSRLGSREIPPQTMQFLFTIGTLPVGLALLIARKFKMERSPKGITYALLNGVLAGVGGLALFAAYHTGSNTALVALYPMITVVLAVVLLRERFRLVQVIGLGFAIVAIVIFSL
jgi:transporter family protein